ncbi:MAG: endonuclease III [Caldisericaceae bacterium]|nr:endonuclease III [Caldisericaceae bacterium]
MTDKRADKIVRILKKELKKYGVPVVTKVAREKKSPYRVLISTLLSLRTKDETTLKASEKLFAKADTPKKMLSLSKKEIEKLIYPVGFYHRKAEQILKISKILIEKYGGKVPDTLEELLKLPGVGRKTANLVLNEGFGKLGICVDTHVHRISNRLGLVKTKNPTETEFALQKVLPKKHWIIFNTLLVTLGQNICTPISPKCSECPLNEICPKIGVKKHR